MTKRRKWKVAAYDGAGNRILTRAVRGEAERVNAEPVNGHRTALRRMMVQDEIREQDHEVRLALGIPVR